MRNFVRSLLQLVKWVWMSECQFTNLTIVQSMRGENVGGINHWWLLFPKLLWDNNYQARTSDQLWSTFGTIRGQREPNEKCVLGSIFFPMVIRLSQSQAFLVMDAAWINLRNISPISKILSRHTLDTVQGCLTHLGSETIYGTIRPEK